MSSSLFDSYRMESIPTNYLEYNKGDKKFTDLKAGEIIYIHSMDSASKILEVTVKTGKIIRRNNLMCMAIEPINITPWEKLKYLEFGPINSGRWFSEIKGKVRNYSPYDITNSSLCESSDGTFVFGTNRDSVLASAKENITMKMVNINGQISFFNTELKYLKDKFNQLK